MELLGYQLKDRGIIMNDDGNNKFNWGETVRVKNTAPHIFRPGEIVSVCGMTKIDSRMLANKYDSNIGEWVYTIEYLGGSDIEIPERYLEKYNGLIDQW
jgi:hypothetical protein